MKQNFTQQDLVKLLYNETTASETLAINDALYSDPALKQEYQQLMEARLQLPRVTFRPASATVQRILQHSKCTAVGREA